MEDLTRSGALGWVWALEELLVADEAEGQAGKRPQRALSATMGAIEEFRLGHFENIGLAVMEEQAGRLCRPGRRLG